MHYARSQPDMQTLQPNGIRRTRSVTAHAERISSSRKSSKSPNATMSKMFSNNAHGQAFSELLPLNMIVQERDGQVLGKSMVLKTDRFPTEIDHLPDLGVHVTDAPNFRQIGDEPIFAVGQPSRHSIRTILNLLKGKTVRWISLREEPIVYLNNRPFVLRELAHPFRNMKDFAGIDYQRLEQIEARLKEDILIEAEKNRGNILVHDEISKHHVRPCWESVTPSSVKTSREVFEHLCHKGYKINYSRIPITPESVFDAKDIDHLIRVFFYSLHSNSDGIHVFSCQMGGGRSTLGSIVMRLLFMRFGLLARTADGIEKVNNHQETANIAAYQKGDYPVIRRLLRVLYHGQEAKQDVDTAINICGAVHNVRNAVLETRMQMEVASDDKTAYLYAKNTALRIQRYFMLICFGAFLRKCFEPGDLSRYVGGKEIKLPPFTFEKFMVENYELGKLAEQCVAEEQLATFVPLISDSIGDQQSESDLIVSKRIGSVLGKNMMLKSVYVLESLTDQEQPSSLSAMSNNYPNFFIVPGVALAALGLPDVNGLLSAVDRLSRQVVPAQATPTINWISLVSEPILFVDSTPFVLRDYFHSFRTLKEFEVGLTSARLAEIEQRLKDDTLQEIQRNNASILLHFETSNSRIRPIVFPVSESSARVQTTSEIFKSVSSSRPDFRLIYKHVPIQAFGAPTPQSLDLLIETIISSLVPGSAICFNCQHGRGRSSLAVSITLLIMMHMGLIHLKSPTETSELVTADSDHCPPDSIQLGCKAILSLTRILKNGRQIVREVDSAIEMSGKVYHLRDVIFDARMRWETERVSQGQSDVYLEKCVQYLQRYAYIVCINSYLHDRFKGKLSADVKFSGWLADRGEIGLWMDNCRNHPLEAVKLPAILATNQNAQVFENRAGSVLVPLSVLKGDYFPGAQRQDLLPILEGAPNFRFIESMRIVGVAVPTKIGVQNVISEVKRHLPDIDFVWMNLREEPLLYINDFPFVLRDVDNPYENLVHTGITTRRVEAMEKQLKRDILEEAKKYGGRILLHDEGEDGNLISFWEEIESPDDVLTCREMFSQSLLGEEMYHRIPITDEHAPLPETFDQILNVLRDTPPSSSRYCISWNCQMGRGRTTTGLVICCLLSLHWPGSNVKLENIPLSATSNRTDTDLADGFYKIIQNLIRVLPEGPKIKVETDQVIDLCSTMQNLRIAILDMKERSTSAVTSAIRDGFARRARDYLIRYFYLIAFNAYLWDCSKTDFTTSFQSWLDDRPEITNHLNNVEV